VHDNQCHIECQAGMAQPRKMCARMTSVQGSFLVPTCPQGVREMERACLSGWGSASVYPSTALPSPLIPILPMPHITEAQEPRTLVSNLARCLLAAGQ
jgi:hypothetical protein